MIAIGSAVSSVYLKSAGRIAGLVGWRRRGVAFLAGSLAATALPPTYVLPALLIAFPVMVWLIDSSRSYRQAFADGWWFGFGHFIAGFYWIGNSLLVNAAEFAWLLPFAVLCIPAILAIYIGIIGLLVRIAPMGNGRIIALASVWALAVWLRGWLFTGFPWNAIGCIWSASDATMQFGAIGGMYALSFVSVFVAASPAILGCAVSTTRWQLPIVATLIGLLLWTGGVVRLTFADINSLPYVVLRIVQPNIPQAIKWAPALREQHLATFLRLSTAESLQPISHIIWPETAVPFVISTDHNRRRLIATAVKKGGYLMTGAIRTTPRGARPFRVWNSFHVIDRAAKIIATYDKFHLVPFGEYIPFRQWNNLAKLTTGRTDFSSGSGPQTLSLPNLPPFSPLICYEVIFPDQIIAPDYAPQWLLNVTNDAWFGTSTGPYQHFAMARLRAVEQGMPLVRAANTGISGVVDAFGRVVGRLGLNQQGVIDVALPKALPYKTPFARMGNAPILIISVFLFFFVIFHRNT